MINLNDDNRLLEVVNMFKETEQELEDNNNNIISSKKWFYIVAIVYIIQLIFLLLIPFKTGYAIFCNVCSLITCFNGVFIYRSSLIKAKNSLESKKNSCLKLITSILNQNIMTNSIEKERNINFNKVISLDIEELEDIEIIPKNIRIGEDLTAKNIVPIFKEGKYVIFKSLINPLFVRVIEDEESISCSLMEPVEDDIYTLREEVPEHEEYIKALELKLKDKFLF